MAHSSQDIPAAETVRESAIKKTEAAWSPRKPQASTPVLSIAS
jgi:hypothetical protein